MIKSIVITGASKGIGRAADALVEQGWSVVGVARSSPRSFPGAFIQTDLADHNQTRTLANDLALRGDVLGIVNNVGVAKHETIDAVELSAFTAVMEFECPPRAAAHSSSIGRDAVSAIWPHHQRDQPCYSRARISFKLRGSKSGARKLNAHYGD
jgi:3-oxoacyl-[acyl-carrier protein] reductase